MIIKLGAILFALVLFIAPTSDMGATNHAESASYLESEVCTGVIAKEADGIEVERQKITISVPELPVPERPASRPASVCTEYTFRNTSKEDAELKLYFPVPAEEERGQACTVEADGTRILPEKRFSFHGSRFDAKEEVDNLLDSKRTDAFFHEDTAVSTTVFTFRADAECEEADYLHLFYKYNPNATRLIFSEGATIKTTNGRVHVFWQFSFGEAEEKSDRAVEVYAVGEPVTPEEVFVSSDAAGEERDELCTATHEPKLSAPAQFGKFVSNLRPPAVPEVDWYNGVVGLLNLKMSNSGYSTVSRNAMTIEWLRPWYEYTVPIAAGETAENAVTVPLVPVVSTRENKSVYSYEYLLSPASFWPVFHTLQVEIVTPYSLDSPSLDFDKIPGGYSIEWSGLPRGELTFSLTEKPERNWGEPTAGLSPSNIVAIVLLGVLVLGSGSCAIAYFVHKRKKNK